MGLRGERGWEARAEPRPLHPGALLPAPPPHPQGPPGTGTAPYGTRVGRERPLLPYPCPPRPSPLPAAGGGRGRVSQRRAGGAPGRARPALQNPARASAGPSRRQSRPACPGQVSPSPSAPAPPARHGAGGGGGPAGPGRGCGWVSGRAVAASPAGAGRWRGAAAALLRAALFSPFGVTRPLLFCARRRGAAAASEGEAAPRELRALRTDTGCGGSARGRGTSRKLGRTSPSTPFFSSLRYTKHRLD